jgi:hypothetical protein
VLLVPDMIAMLLCSIVITLMLPPLLDDIQHELEHTVLITWPVDIIRIVKHFLMPRAWIVVGTPTPMNHSRLLVMTLRIDCAIIGSDQHAYAMFPATAFHGGSSWTQLGYYHHYSTNCYDSRIFMLHNELQVMGQPFRWIATSSSVGKESKDQWGQEAIRLRYASNHNYDTNDTTFMAASTDTDATTSVADLYYSRQSYATSIQLPMPLPPPRPKSVEPFALSHPNRKVLACITIDDTYLYVISFSLVNYPTKQWFFNRCDTRVRNRNVTKSNTIDSSSGDSSTDVGDMVWTTFATLPPCIDGVVANQGLLNHEDVTCVVWGGDIYAHVHMSSWHAPQLWCYQIIPNTWTQVIIANATTSIRARTSLSAPTSVLPFPAVSSVAPSSPLRRSSVVVSVPEGLAFLGGFGNDGQWSGSIDVLDLTTRTWSIGVYKTSPCIPLSMGIYVDGLLCLANVALVSSNPCYAIEWRARASKFIRLPSLPLSTLPNIAMGSLVL